MPAKYATGKLQFTNPGSLGTGAFSFEGLFYLADIATQNQYLFHMQAGAGASPNTILFVDTTGKLNFWVNGGSARVSNTTAMTVNRWYRVVGTCNNTGSGGTVCRMWLDETESDYTGATVAVSVGTHTGDVNIGGRNYDSGSRNIVNGMSHKVRIYNVVLDPTHIQTRGLDLATQYAANLVLRADLDSNLNGLDSTGAATTGTATSCTLQQWPVNKTRLCGWYRPSDAGNTVTAGRYSTLLDLSGCSNNLTEVSSSGPAQVTSSGVGLGIEHAWFDGSTDYLQKSAGAVLSNQRHTLVGFAGSYNTPWGAERVLAAVGTLATTDSDVASIGVKTGTGQPISTINGVAVGTHTLAHSTTPRMLAYSADDTNGAIWSDDRWEACSRDATPDTDDDLRVGASMATTPGEFWYGQLYELFVFSESYTADGDLDDLHALGITRGYYAAATRLVTFEGSSSVAGSSSTLGQNLPMRVADTLSDAIVLNYSNSAENRAHFSSGYATQPGSSYALGWFSKSSRFFILQPFGNDYLGTGTEGYSGTVTFASVLSDYQAIVTTASADYQRIAHWETIARGSVGVAVVDDDNIGERERDRRLVFSGLTGVYRLNMDTISALDPVINVDTMVNFEIADAVHLITTGGNYAGDEIHLDNDGFALLATQFDARYSGLIATGGARWRASRNGRCR